MVSFDVDVNKVCECINNNSKFISPFSELYGYYICIWNQKNKKYVDNNMVELYLNKLKYAVTNTDALIEQAFQMFRSKIDLPRDLWKKLRFESFVLAVDEKERKEIACCLSNPDFMLGHYIECRWDFNWNLIFICYC